MTVTRGSEFWEKQINKGSFQEALLCEIGVPCPSYLHIFCSGYTFFLTK